MHCDSICTYCTHLTLKMTTTQVVIASITVNNSPIQDFVHLGDHTQSTYEMTPGFKPFTVYCVLFLSLGYHVGHLLGHIKSQVIQKYTFCSFWAYGCQNISFDKGLWFALYMGFKPKCFDYYLIRQPRLIFLKNTVMVIKLINFSEAVLWQ